MQYNTKSGIFYVYIIYSFIQNTFSGTEIMYLNVLIKHIPFFVFSIYMFLFFSHCIWNQLWIPFTVVPDIAHHNKEQFLSMILTSYFFWLINQNNFTYFVQKKQIYLTHSNNCHACVLSCISMHTFSLIKV